MVMHEKNNKLFIQLKKFIPLNIIFSIGQKEIVELLIQNGANINALSDTNSTSLALAASYGNER